MQSAFSVPKKLTKQVEELARGNDLNFSHFSHKTWKGANVTVAGKVEDFNTFLEQLQELLEKKKN